MIHDDWQIPEEEFKKRLDLRNECIFTIDPPTAKDLDDALSCKKIDNDIYEIGIHIADVSYFVKPDNNLDKEAYKKGTSTYLVQKVIHMLPEKLCENICSLNAGTDRLAFSIIITMNKDAEIISSRAVKTVICSCAKLSYDHVQNIIDNHGKWSNKNDTVVIYNNFSKEDICEKINDLYHISKILKKKRYNNGAISLNKKKLWFKLDKIDSLPLDFGIFQNPEANSLIEEFMLLANTIVAKKLYDAYPNEALLRFHDWPDPTNILKFLVLLRKTNKIEIDASDSKALHESLIAIRKKNSIYSDVALARCIKFMKRALYTCSSKDKSNKLFHYGLHIPFYTHFTSPIRRYPDIIVHRQLEALINKRTTSPYSREKIFKIAKHCNDTKINAKKAQESSNMLYLIYHLNEYIKKNKKNYIIEEALVMGFDNYYIEITLPNLACEDKISSIWLKDMDIIKEVQIKTPKKNNELRLESNISNEEAIFDLYWDNDITIDDVMKKFNDNESLKINDKQKRRKSSNSNDYNNNSSDSNKNDNNNNNNNNSSSSNNDNKKDNANNNSDENNNNDNNNNSNNENKKDNDSNKDDDDNEKLKDNFKQYLSNYYKQTLKIFDSIKIIIIPNFDNEKITILLVPPKEANRYNIESSYNLSSNEDDNNIIKFEPENNYD